jgi:exopolysaccharide biosynthesis polyprenyl glycosylphosphotransferase
MIRRQRSGLICLYVLSDVVGIVISYLYSYGFRFYGYILPVGKGIPSLKSYIIVLFLLFLPIHLVIFFLQGFYRKRLKRTGIDEFFLITLNTVLTILAVQAVLAYTNAYSQGAAPLFRISFTLSHLFLAVYFVVVILMISFLRHQIYFYMRRRYAKGINLKNVLIIGAGEMGRAVGKKLFQYKDLGFVVKGFVDDEREEGEWIDADGGIKVLGSLNRLESVLEEEDISDVYVALDLENYHKILETLKVVDKYVVNVRLVPDLFQLLTLKARIEDLDGFPVISVDQPPLKGVMLVVKRIMDLSASVVLLAIFAPFFLVISPLIKLTSRGPVFYHQERMGLDGKKFIMHKFRTMVHNAESKTGPVMCSSSDPRVTKFGRFLRRFSLDEIPQLINVLKGEMSLVGPRPERPVFVKEFREKIPKYMLRHKVKSGITGWAQVHGLRQDTSIDKRLEYDFYYIQNWSFSLDLKILWMTLRKGFIDRTV